jgi:uncharacterized membrane protein
MAWLRSYLTGMRASIRPQWRLRPGRAREVDALRGVAILMMVVYHLLWDLQGLGSFAIDVYRGFWHYFQLTTASLFTGIVGISLVLRYQSLAQQGPPTYGPFLQRGVQIFSWGIVIGIVTYLFEPTFYVRFGILHLIGFAIIVSWPLLRWRRLNLVLGLGLLALGRLIPVWGLDIGWLDWLGLDATPRPAFDHFPVIPWLGLPLLGIFVGKTLYRDGARPFAAATWPEWGPIRLLRLLGQNSLLIYLIHQPILLTVLTLLGLISL